MINKLSAYKYSTFFLVLVNAALLALIYFNSQKPRNNDFTREEGKTFIKEMLDLDEEQIQLFEQSSQSHIKNMKDLNDRHKSIVAEYLKSIQSQDENLKEKLISEIKSIEEKKLKDTYLHLSEVKNMLNDEQSNNFDNFLTHVTRIVQDGDRKPPHENRQAGENRPPD